MRTRFPRLTHHNRPGPSLMIGIALLTLMLPGLGAALNAVMRQNTIDFCYAPASGSVYRIREPGLPDACHASTHTEFSVNVQGIPGPAGPIGPEGPQGEQGEPGLPGAGGLSGLVIVTRDVVVPSGTSIVDEIVSCPLGKVALSGGWSMSSEFKVPMSVPTAGGAWHIVLIRESDTTDTSVILTSLCAESS